MAQANDNTQVSPLKIRRSDWKRLPDFFKSYTDGIPRVLTRINGVAYFRPVQILH